jgi:hypothetical protein
MAPAAESLFSETTADRHRFIKSFPNLRNLEISICFGPPTSFRTHRTVCFNCLNLLGCLDRLLKDLEKCALGIVGPNITFKVYS